MSDNKIFQVAFEISGRMSSAFTSSMDASKRQIKQLGDTTKFIAAEQRRLNKLFDAGGISAGKYAERMRAMNKEIDQAKAKQTALSRSMSNSKMAGAQFSSAAGGLMSAGFKTAAVALPFAGIIKTAADFQAKMSKVQAITGATNADMQKLTNTARTLGEKTQFSAKQSADAMSYLGMAGWKTNQIIAGMPGLLDLAAAGGTDLATTADIVSDDLTAFGLSAEQSTHMADVFAVAVTNTNTNVSMLGETMKYAAPVAHAFGASMEETTAMAGLMANSGVKASSAGTALRAGFLRLAGPPKQASAAMKALGMNMSDITKQQLEAKAALASLGIQMNDTNGPRKMTAIIKELADKTKNMGNEQKLATLKAIFGTTAASGWLNVINQGPEALDKLTTKLEHSNGAAAKMAHVMNDNAKGAAIRLQSAMESASISIGNTFLPAVANIATELAGGAAALSQFATQYPGVVSWTVKAAVVIAGLTLAYKAGKVALAGYNVVKAGFIGLTKREIVATGIAKGKTIAMATATKIAAAAQWVLNAAMDANPIGLVIAGIAALIAIGYVLYRNFDKVKALCTRMWQSPAAAAIAFVTGPIGWVIYAGAGLIASWGRVKQWFVTLWYSPEQALSEFCSFIYSKLGAAFNWLSNKWSWLKGIFSKPIKAKVQASATGGGKAQVYHNAVGGLYGKGSFLTTFAENSAEAAIPLDGSQRAVSLWQKAGDILGANKNGGNTYNFSYSPNITGGNAETIREADRQQRDFFDRVKEFMHERERVSYGL